LPFLQRTQAKGDEGVNRTNKREVIMKVKIRKTGEIVNIAEYAKITLEQCDSYGNPIELKPEEVELIQEQAEDEHWQDVRERAAIVAMQGVMYFFGSIDYNKETIAKVAVEQADALIKQLKEK
jgi:hypothetical protein